MCHSTKLSGYAGNPNVGCLIYIESHCFVFLLPLFICVSMCVCVFCIVDKYILSSFQGHVKMAKFGLYYITDRGADVDFPIG